MFKKFFLNSRNVIKSPLYIMPWIVFIIFLSKVGFDFETFFSKHDPIAVISLFAIYYSVAVKPILDFIETLLTKSKGAHKYRVIHSLTRTAWSDDETYFSKLLVIDPIVTIDEVTDSKVPYYISDAGAVTRHTPKRFSALPGTPSLETEGDTLVSKVKLPISWRAVINPFAYDTYRAVSFTYEYDVNMYPDKTKEFFIIENTWSGVAEITAIIDLPPGVEIGTALIKAKPRDNIKVEEVFEDESIDITTTKSVKIQIIDSQHLITGDATKSIYVIIKNPSPPYKRQITSYKITWVYQEP